MTQTNANADGRAVATALGGAIVRGEQNMLADTAAPGIEGAHAALETFYHAFNTRSLDLYQRIWADDPLVQLSSPVGGIVRGSAGIAALSERMFSGSMRVQTVFEDIVAYVTPDLVVFTGRERGTYTHDGEHDAVSELPDIRSICIFRFIAEQGGGRSIIMFHLMTRISSPGISARCAAPRRETSYLRSQKRTSYCLRLGTGTCRRRARRLGLAPPTRHRGGGWGERIAQDNNAARSARHSCRRWRRFSWASTPAGRSATSHGYLARHKKVRSREYPSLDLVLPPICARQHV